jgi:hypothetical protein
LGWAVSPIVHPVFSNTVVAETFTGGKPDIPIPVCGQQAGPGFVADAQQPVTVFQLIRTFIQPEKTVDSSNPYMPLCIFNKSVDADHLIDLIVAVSIVIVKLARSTIQQVWIAFVGAYPKSVPAILKNSCDQVCLQRIGIMEVGSIGYAAMTIIALKAVEGSHPNISLAVLADRCNRISGKPVFHGQMTKHIIPVLRVNCGKKQTTDRQAQPGNYGEQGSGAMQ